MNIGTIIMRGVIIKIKRIIILCLILCVIFSLQAVVAADSDLDHTNDTALTTADANVVKHSNDQSSLSASENNDSLGDGELSFTTLYDRIKNGGTVTLSENFTYSGFSQWVIYG